MSLYRFTPGPWFVSEDRRLHGSESFVAGYNIESEVERVVWDEGISGGSRDEANARLIAAAPELLVALRKLARSLAEHLEAGTIKCECCCIELEQARAVIAKATGAQP